MSLDSRNTRSKKVFAVVDLSSELASVVSAMGRATARRDHCLDQWLTYLGWTQGELADRVGVGPNTVSRWVRREQGIDTKYINSVLKALGTTPDKFWDYHNPLKGNGTFSSVEKERNWVAPRSKSPHPATENEHFRERETPTTTNHGGEVAEIIQMLEGRLVKASEQHEELLKGQRALAEESHQRSQRLLQMLEAMERQVDSTEKLRLAIYDLTAAITRTRREAG